MKEHLLQEGLIKSLRVNNPPVDNRIYNRALSATEIQQLYTLEKPANECHFIIKHKV